MIPMVPTIRLTALFALALLALPAVATSRGTGTVRLRLGEDLIAALGEDHRIYLETSPQRGEGLLGFAKRLCGDVRQADRLAAANGGKRDLKTGVRYRVPYEMLAPEHQLRVVRALFAEDRPEADGWRHKVRGVGGLQRESLWHLASWFTGDGANFRALREYNELGDDEMARGATLTIPAELLLPAFRGALPAPESGHRLAYGKDKAGDYAVYRLRTGEALYSSVVVRFTGRIHAADVNALATQIAARSGIADVTDIPIGFRVKIPLDLLQPEFLPPGNPRRLEYEASLRASERFTNQVRALGLEGITVILDAGHGGKDSGATLAGVWESLYVYDIVLRIKHLLETRTAARVAVTTRDGQEFRIADSDVLPFSRRHAVLTNPPYLIEDSSIGVNLRWYLANSLFRRAVQEQGDPEKIVFLSLHADSLHPSLRGAMAYIPAAALREESYGKSGAVYASRQEYKESPSVRFPRQQRVMSEGLSRELALELIGSFQRRALAVHPFKPVREKVIRNQQEWVPAVLRYNAVPAKILLEVCNLANDEDRRLIQTRSYRQRVSEAVVAGILGYYGQDKSLPSVAVAETAK
jgi:N-acetylmuramoyl-L-alanine amidase